MFRHAEVVCFVFFLWQSQVRPRTFECIATCNAVLFILKSRLLVYSAGSGVKRMQVVWPGFSVTLVCFVQEKNVMYVCMVVFIYLLTGQVGLGVGSWPSNRAPEGSNPKGTRLYFVILLKNVENIFDWHRYNRLKDGLVCC